MTANTAKHNILKPVNADAISTIADTMGTALDSIDGLLDQAFTVAITMPSGSIAVSAAVAWPFALAAGITPAVVCSVASTGVTAGYFAHCYSVTNTGCQVRVDKLVGAAPGANVPMLVGFRVTARQAAL